MNSAPWWFVLVTALVTGGLTLSGSWLTGRGALTTKREELAHLRTLEREKQLYNRRIDLYVEILPLVNEITTSLEAHDRLLHHAGPTTGDAFDKAPDHIAERIKKLPELTARVEIVSGKDVCALMRQFSQDAKIALARLNRGERLEDIVLTTEVDSSAQHLQFEIRVEIGTFSRSDYSDEFE